VIQATQPTSLVKEYPISHSQALTTSVAEFRTSAACQIILLSCMCHPTPHSQTVAQESDLSSILSQKMAPSRDHLEAVPKRQQNQ